MEGAAIVADVPAFTGSSMSYNISLNLSSIFSFSPSRLLARLRKGVLGQPVDPSDIPATTAADILAQEQPLLQNAPTPPSNVTVYPGPWGFFTSGYMMGLVLVAVLLHRMQNIIIPSRVPGSPALNRRGRRSPRFSALQNLPFLRRIYSAILPLNFASTSTRLALHLPSMYFLCKVLVLWFVLVLQASSLFPEISAPTTEAWRLAWVHRLGSWGQEKQMSEICWTTFCAVCAAFSVEGFMKALDGIGTGFPIGGNINPNTSPFNLVGYAFLLHIYSNPVTHLSQMDGLPTRPDKHVTITIAIPLLQLTIFHALSISKRLSTHRLIPTTLTSLLSLVHFHGTLISHYYKLKYPTPAPTPTQNVSARQLSTMQSITTTYPLLNYIPNIFETALVATILLTVILNTLVQILVRGRVERVFSGLGLGLVMSSLHDDNPTHAGIIGQIRAFFRSLPHDEDFGVLLLRIGTASLEATGLRGWGNEVAPVPAPIPSRPRRGRGGPVFGGIREYGMVSMGRVGVGFVRSGYQIHDPASAPRRRGRGMFKRLRGLGNEVRKVDVGTDFTQGPERGWTEWVWELVWFVAVMWGVLKGAFKFVWFWVLDRVRGKGRRGVLRRGMVVEVREEEEIGDSGNADAGVEEGEGGDDDEMLYQRFLRGDNISDDDEDDEADESAEEDFEDVEEDDEEEVDRQGEALGLFTDLIQSGEREGHQGEMVLAHLVHGLGTNRPPSSSMSGSGRTTGMSPSSTGPLTRRKWRDLLSIGDPREREGGLEDLSDDDDEEFSNFRGPYDDDKKERELDMRHVCVVCTIEARDIICWPCRCLAMCDGCRESLASRSAPTKHRCPCCRQIIDGYSRIYIP